MLDMETKMKIAAVVLGAKDVTQLRGEIERTQKAAGKPAPDFTSNMRAGAAQTRGIITELGRELAAFAGGAAILNFARTSVQEFAKAESSFRGLESVANASGFGIQNAMKAAAKLSADGLISVADASKALQNLLARGYNLDQAIAVIERLKDSAAFNRVAHLSMAEAVVSATEGLKNENSTLVDNAGVTKNVSKIWGEYAAKLGITVESLTQAQKIEAEYQGILRETEAQLGNSQKALAGYQGQVALADQATLKYKQSLGELLVPAFEGFARIGTFVVNNVLKPLTLSIQAAGVGLGFLARTQSRIIDGLLSLNFKGVGSGIKSDFKEAADMVDEFAKRLFNSQLQISETLTGGADAAKIAANAKRLAENNGKDQKKLIDDRIKDYGRLRDAIRKAWEDSIQAEKDYLAEAKKLRSEANAFDSKSLTGASPQEVAGVEISKKADLRIAGDRLRRLVSEGGSISDIRNQAQVVQDLASEYRSLADAVEGDAYKSEIAQRADEAVKQSKLNLATVLEQSATVEKQRQQDQLKILADIENALTALEQPRTINVVADQANQALGEVKAGIDGLQDKTVTITVRRVDAANAANFTGAYDSKGNALYLDPNSGGATGSFATGGFIRGPGHDTSDNLLAWLSPGEFVVQAAAVRKYGLDRFAAMNAMHLPKFNTGGAVSRMRLPSLPAGASPSTPMHRGTFNFPGVRSVDLQGRSDVFDALTRESLRLRKR